LDAIKSGDIEIMHGGLLDFARGTGSVHGMANKAGQDVSNKGRSFFDSVKDAIKRVLPSGD
jgi:hypothetical protein